MTGAAQSLYTDDFLPVAAGTVGRSNPPSYLSTKLPPDLPLMSATNYQTDFAAPKRVSGTKIHKEVDRKMPERPFDARSSYTVDYTDKKGKPSKLSELSGVKGKGNSFTQIPDVPFTCVPPPLCCGPSKTLQSCAAHGACHTTYPRCSVQ